MVQASMLGSKEAPAWTLALSKGKIMDKLYKMYWNCKLLSNEYIRGSLNLFGFINVVFAVSFLIHIVIGYNLHKYEAICFVIFIALTFWGFMVPYLCREFKKSFISSCGELKLMFVERIGLSIKIYKFMSIIIGLVIDVFQYLLVFLFGLSLFLISHIDKVKYLMGILKGKFNFIDRYSLYMENVGLPWWSIFIVISIFHIIAFYKIEYLPYKAN